MEQKNNPNPESGEGNPSAESSNEQQKQPTNVEKFAKGRGPQNTEAKPTPQDEQIAELNNKLLRTVAELENTRKRSEQQASELKKFAISSFAKELTVILENFHLMMDNAPIEELKSSENLKNFFQGAEMTRDEIEKIFQKHGIKRIFPLNEKFDHHLHQAVTQIESDKEPGTIVQVIQAGYVINDRILKEALVAIAK